MTVLTQAIREISSHLSVVLDEQNLHHALPSSPAASPEHGAGEQDRDAERHRQHTLRFHDRLLPRRKVRERAGDESGAVAADGAYDNAVVAGLDETQRRFGRERLTGRERRGRHFLVRAPIPEIDRLLLTSVELNHADA